jgi:hypothetical protein
LFIFKNMFVLRVIFLVTKIENYIKVYIHILLHRGNCHVQTSKLCCFPSINSIREEEKLLKNERRKNF